MAKPDSDMQGRDGGSCPAAGASILGRPQNVRAGLREGQTKNLRPSAVSLLMFSA